MVAKEQIEMTAFTDMSVSLMEKWGPNHEGQTPCATDHIPKAPAQCH